MNLLPPLHFDQYNIYWFALLLLTSIQSLAAVVGTSVFQKRNHFRLALVNDVFARLQLGIITFCGALLISAGIATEWEQLVKIWIVALLFLAFISYLFAVRHASSFLERVGHTCPMYPAVCTERVKWTKAIRSTWWNVTSYLILFALGSLIILSLGQETQSGSHVIRQKPQGSPAIKALPYSGQPDWYSDHQHWLEQEGDRDKAKKIIGTYGLGEAEYTVPVPSSPFDVILRVSENYTIAGHAAFRITTSKGRTLREQLDVKVPSENFRELRATALECEKDDRIIVLFRVETKAQGASMDLEDIVNGRIDP